MEAALQMRESVPLTEEQQRCMDLYDAEDLLVMALADAAKGKGLSRIDEIARFARAAGYTRLGIAHCVAVREAAQRLEERLALEGFEVSRVDCKVCKLPAAALSPGGRGISCNPIGQARQLAQADTQLNISLGLCLGHDLLFAKHSRAPVTTLIVKDRSNGHNPLLALIS
ncbi:DUF1847 domain-containing protein [Syntrophotalea acetylenica]|uniref:DUF1847 domain-containing protein n=1 Tax=Syntrophotalea TaxID=2812025 RepID=UPI002A367784|nr:DUF1847 domain-containing protein [Syntrophotalea acetylenica]MDY0261427.1 DUF1847 domain-containing protein [Syntrophotalea acetylenica]